MMTICLILAWAVARSTGPPELGAAVVGWDGASVGAGGIVFCTTGGLFTVVLADCEDWSELGLGAVNEQASNRISIMTNFKILPLFIILTPLGDPKR